MWVGPFLLLRLWAAPVEDEATGESDPVVAPEPEAHGGRLFVGPFLGGGMGPTTQGVGHFGFMAGSFGRRIGGHVDLAMLGSRPVEIGAYEVSMLGFWVGASVCHVLRSRGGRLLLPVCGGFEGGLLSAKIRPPDRKDRFDALSEGLPWGAGRLSIGAMLSFDGFLLGTTWTLSAPTYQGTFPSVVPSLRSVVPLGFRVSLVFVLGSRESPA